MGKCSLLSVQLMLKCMMMVLRWRVLQLLHKYLPIVAMLIDTLAKIAVSHVVGGKIAGEAFPVSQLWREAPAVVFVVRRPG